MTPEVHRLRSISNLDEVVVGDLVLLELLQGARSERDATRIRDGLRLFRAASMLDEDIAIAAARNYRQLRGIGIGIRRTTMIIGTFCIQNGHRLLHRDRDFDHMQQHLGLQVY